jgi:alkylation response protein AidB-like acyl-CoA dehydrogenase
MYKTLRKFSTRVLDGTWDLTSEQQAIHDLALKFSDQEVAPNASEWDSNALFPRDVIKSSAKLGFGGLYCKPEFGGSNLSRLETTLVFEALAKGCVSFSVYSTVHNMVAWILDTFGSQELKSKYLYSLISYDLFGSYCLTEPGSGSDASALKTVAKIDGNDYIINGSKMYITGGIASDVMIVMCKTGEKEISCILVESNSKGINFNKNELKLGWNSNPTNLVNFDNVRVPVCNLIGQPGMGFKIALQALEGGRINISSCGLGGAWFALEAAKNYMQIREQFNKKLSEFQYLSFIMAEAFTKLTVSRILVRHAANLLDTKNPDKICVGSMAKFFTTDNCFEAVNVALQMHGGMGVIKSTGVERVFRDLRILQIVEGTNEIMRLLISRSLFQE